MTHNTQKDRSVFANYRPTEYLQVNADYVHKTSEAGANPGENKDDQLLVRMIFIFWQDCSGRGPQRIPALLSLKDLTAANRGDGSTSSCTA